MDSQYSICNQHEETVTHSLWSCPRARNEWALIRRRFQKMANIEEDDFFFLTQNCLLNASNNETEMWVMTVWAIWDARNKVLFEDCRGPFFQSTVDQIQHLSDPPGVQSPTTLVIHGKRNMRKNGPKAIHRAQSPKEERKAQPTCSSNSSLPHKGILK